MYHSVKFMSSWQTWYGKSRTSGITCKQRAERRDYYTVPLFCPTLSQTRNLAQAALITFFPNLYMGLSFFIPCLIVGSEIKFWLGAKVFLDVVSHFEPSAPVLNSDWKIASWSSHSEYRSQWCCRKILYCESTQNFHTLQLYEPQQT